MNKLIDVPCKSNINNAVEEHAYLNRKNKFLDYLFCR